jgi:hypothetical protein
VYNFLIGVNEKNSQYIGLDMTGWENCRWHKPRCSGYTLPSPDNNEVRIFAQDVCGGVDNNPPNPTVFTIEQLRTITKIGTYHWNDGKGTQTPGTIGLQDQNSKVYGPWQASGQPGQGGVPNAYWIVTLPSRLDLPAGTYKVLDSDPSTWAYNSESDNSGVVSIVGLNVGSTTATQAPCAGEGVDYSPRSSTDLYDAGPGLVPGSYRIWYGKRTGTQIGRPDNWNTYGPVELLGGKFYVFDVATGDFGPANPQMINPMLSEPTPGESLVWYKLSTQYAYVICFDGPLNNTKEGIQLTGSWKMTGHQTGFNDWEADLVLNNEGTLSWTETKGANVGATRTGTWQFNGTTFTMSWVSPGGGQTNWISQSVNQNNIGDGTYTVENAPGGTWSATRVTEGL